MTAVVFMLLSLGAFPQLPASWLRYPGRWYMAALSLLALSRVISLQPILSLKRFLILFFCLLPALVFVHLYGGSSPESSRRTRDDPPKKENPQPLSLFT